MLNYIQLRRVLIFLAILLSLSACRTMAVSGTGYAQVGYYSYYYYPDVEVYYDTGRHSYFYFSNGLWRAATVLPPALRLHLGSPVTLRLDSHEPYHYHPSHRKTYPHGYFNKSHPRPASGQPVPRQITPRQITPRQNMPSQIIPRSGGIPQRHDVDIHSRPGSERGAHRIETRVQSKESSRHLRKEPGKVPGKVQVNDATKNKSKNQNNSKQKTKTNSKYKDKPRDSEKSKERGDGNESKQERDSAVDAKGERRHTYK